MDLLLKNCYNLFYQTALTCKMIPLAPFVVHGARKISQDELQNTGKQLLEVIIAGFGHFGSIIGRLLKVNGVQATF